MSTAWASSVIRASLLQGLLVLMLFSGPAEAATPSYLEPSKPYRTFFSSSPDKEECDAIKEEWDEYWNELSARHQPCLDAHSGSNAQQERGGSCSYAACEPYHNINGKDPEARTAIKNCYAAAAEKEQAQRDAEAQAAENERELKKQAEENARRAEKEARDAEARQQKLKDDKEKRDDEEQKLADDRRKKREEEEAEKLREENRIKSTDRRDKARDDYWKQKHEDAKMGEIREKNFARKSDQLDQKLAETEERKTGLIAEARSLVESRFSVPLPAPPSKGRVSSTAELDAQMDTISAMGDRYYSTLGKANFANIPMALVKDIQRVTFQNVLAIEHVIDDFNRTGSASTEALDNALNSYGEVFSVENLLRRTVADNAVSNTLQANETLEFLPSTWTVAVESVGQENIVTAVQPPVSKLYDKLAETWLWPR